MSNDRTSPISVPNPENRHRRGSIADIFSKSSNTNQASQSNQANQRRLSISTLGLSGSPTQTAFGNQNFRRGSISSSLGSVPNTDDAIAEDAEESPNSQFARRVSFGAQALRDARGSTGNGEGFNWSEALRSRAERAPSLGAPVSPQAQQRQSGYHQRAASIASMEQPGREMPRQAKQNKPDFFQEKILRGDFMD
ncbi:hypothetical protein N7499_004795 [Penicillium canescens]|uniref:Uncharacterized protein n=1 Tax=Penicillium canescens TaxID=5083 RepID=A0AAD6N351_PENCN|nr:uncharacterized protein N7446_004701 [Penicillium canescens]KAJ6009804.1 hypothetical protein N7522_004820 [Penicillium canescens]KAJ6026697.1 hypothetical protein N7460_011514 [Penicillium canescens]KAJ6039979.1 hypothetical protein N7444_008884 [Penicillium canescens]KAJ6067664.1 hypothetical protein N7446_004701 [Penicillium canescens]KAJ6085166.1 hypothetical protein N7499_004795 [Penicillium canescens]